VPASAGELDIFPAGEGRGRTTASGRSRRSLHALRGGRRGERVLTMLTLPPKTPPETPRSGPARRRTGRSRRPGSCPEPPHQIRDNAFRSPPVIW
jgi:hypothetical protein